MILDSDFVASIPPITFISTLMVFGVVFWCQFSWASVQNTPEGIQLLSLHSSTAAQFTTPHHARFRVET